MKIKAQFIEPMLLLRTEKLPEGDAWLKELKWDGYGAIAFKTGGRIQLRSRNDNDFTERYVEIVKALASIPEETVLDGEVVARDETGRPSFNVLQNYGAGKAPLYYYLFDMPVLAGRDLRHETLLARRGLLEQQIMPDMQEPVRLSPVLDAPLLDVIVAVKAQGLEGIVAKRKDSRYEAGLRSGAWMKMRVNQGQEFVIGGYTVGGRTFDALVFGYYEGGKLMYAARTRNGFTPPLRDALMKRFKAL